MTLQLLYERIAHASQLEQAFMLLGFGTGLCLSGIVVALIGAFLL